MAKYSEGFKLLLVKQYLEKSLGYEYLAREYGIPSSTPIKRGMRAYQEFGEGGLRRKQTKQVYSVQFKV
ncbi:IS3 family transposase, partial [Planococcus sp. MB-3u-09]